jgi:DNA-binding TFAR19-related protein (PDSD5 family)
VEGQDLQEVKAKKVSWVRRESQESTAKELRDRRVKQVQEAILVSRVRRVTRDRLAWVTFLHHFIALSIEFNFCNNY